MAVKKKFKHRDLPLFDQAQAEEVQRLEAAGWRNIVFGTLTYWIEPGSTSSKTQGDAIRRLDELALLESGVKK